MKSKILLILSILGFFFGLGLLAWAFYPLAKFYFSGFSAFGDWFVGYAYVDYIKEHFALPPVSWLYRFETGAPLFTFYQWFVFYLMQPLAHLFGSALGMEVFSFACLMLFFLFAYLLFWQLSRNPIFSAFLTLILYYSHGVSDALMRAGYITQNATQFFLPLSLWLITIFYQKDNKRFLVLAATFAGLAVLSHVGIGLFLVFAPTALTVFFWWDKKVKLFSWRKVKAALVYLSIAFLIVSSAIITGIFNQAGTVGKAVCDTPTCVASIEILSQYFNPWSLFVLGGIAGIVILWAIIIRRNCFRRTLPFLAILGFIFTYLAVTHFKLALTEGLSTSIWPQRTVWAISLGMGAVAAVLFREIKGKGKLTNYFALGLQVLLSFTTLGLSLWMVTSKPYDLLPEFEKDRGIYEHNGPHLVRYTIDKYRVGPYKDYNRSMVLPGWLPPDDLNYRIDQLWHGDFGFWPLFTKMPDVRAYAGNTNPRFDDWRAWLSAAETDQLGPEENRGKQSQASINQSLFMLDWYAIRYLNTSFDYYSGNLPEAASYAPFMKSEWLTDKHELIEGARHYFNFWRIKEEFTSPIVTVTNVPTVLFVGDEQGWVNFVRALGVSNTNSSKIIPVKGSQKLEDLSLKELKDFDLVVLYGYTYGDFGRAWGNLKRFVEEGGLLFIDTGKEVKESENESLPLSITEMPNLLPSRVLKRESLGKRRDFQISPSSVTEDINFSQFAPLVFDEQPWKLSFVPDDKDLREGTQVLLRQNGRPILATREIGEGKVFWSGLNLPYYIIHYQGLEEARLLRQLIEWGIGELGETKPEFTFERPRPEKVIVYGNDFQGVVFKENFDSGWKAKVNGRGVKIYRAGPDLMFISVPQSVEKPIKVEMTYRGTLLNWFLFIVSLTTLVATLINVITGNLIKVGGKSLDKIKVTGKIASWWEKDEI